MQPKGTPMNDIRWDQTRNSEIPRKYTCGHLGKFAPAHQHYLAIPLDASNTQHRHIFICPNCDQPTYFPSEYGPQVPGAPFGNDVAHLPYGVEQLYREARRCMTIEAHAAAVLLCRKILMHVAVGVGADGGQNFTEYLDYLNSRGYLTTQNKGWVDHIRQKGNNANHKIDPLYRKDAEDLINFTEMLLRLVYEFPTKAPARVR